MSMYRNSILKFNPRSFLELAKNSVNLEIEQSILKKDNNEFSLYNNGITIISDRTAISSDTAKHGTAQLILTNPQLVNGGQTAYVLGRIYEDCVSKNSFKALKGKEVLLRVITFSVVPELKNLGTRLGLISDISKASNSQTKIEEADRRSGDEIQIRLQEELFKEFGMYYERKKGEFSDGIRDGYIDQNQLVSREDVIRVALAANYQIKAIRSGIARYFQESQLSALLKMKDVNKYGYGSEVLQLLGQLQKAKPAKKGDRYHVDVYGQALRFGLNSVLAVCINLGLHTNVPADLIVPTVLAQWRDFDIWAANQPANAIYLGGSTPDLGAYYRGSTLEGDIQTYPGFLIT